MGLLKYQAMPSLRGVAHVGVLVHSVIDQLQTGPAVVRHGRRHEPSITYTITPCWVTFITFIKPARRAAVLDQPSSLRPL